MSIHRLFVKDGFFTDMSVSDAFNSMRSIKMLGFLFCFMTLENTDLKED